MHTQTRNMQCAISCSSCRAWRNLGYGADALLQQFNGLAEARLLWIRRTPLRNWYSSIHGPWARAGEGGEKVSRRGRPSTSSVLKTPTGTPKVKKVRAGKLVASVQSTPLEPPLQTPERLPAPTPAANLTVDIVRSTGRVRLSFPGIAIDIGVLNK
jgi:hypothetical protein